MIFIRLLIAHLIYFQNSLGFTDQAKSKRLVCKMCAHIEQSHCCSACQGSEAKGAIALQ